ncbi:hypothetical protein Bca4012_083950 [Brassica carinata]
MVWVTEIEKKNHFLDLDIDCEISLSKAVYSSIKRTRISKAIKHHSQMPNTANKWSFVSCQFIHGGQSLSSVTRSLLHQFRSDVRRGGELMSLDMLLLDLKHGHPRHKGKSTNAVLKHCQSRTKTSTFKGQRISF